MRTQPAAADLLNQAWTIPRQLFRATVSGDARAAIHVAAWTADGFVDNHGDNHGTAHQVALAYERAPASFPRGLSDPLAVIVVDRLRGRLIAARDPVGTRPVFYQLDGDKISLAWSMVPFAEGQPRHPQLNRQWLANYLGGVPRDRRATALHGVHELAPGEVLTVTADDRAIKRWYRFSGPAQLFGPSSQAIETYRHSVLDTVRHARSPAGTVVELDVGPGSAVLAGAATSDLRRWSPDVRGTARANFDTSRDGVLALASEFGIAHVDVITGRPGRAIMWSHWYSSAAATIGQPVDPSVLPIVAELEMVANSPMRRMLRSRPMNLGMRFVPSLAVQALHVGRLDLALKSQPTGIRGKLRSLGDLLKPGDDNQFPASSRFLTPEVPRQIRRLPSGKLSRTTSTGYSGITEHGLPVDMVRRLAAESLLGARHGMDVRYPLLGTEVLSNLLRIPLLANSFRGIPGAALTEAFPDVLGPGARWPRPHRLGQEKPKSRQEMTASMAARQQYLREQLSPLLEEFVDRQELMRFLDIRIRRSQEGHDLPGSPVDAKTLARIEAANHWLATWPLITSGSS